MELLDSVANFRSEQAPLLSNTLVINGRFCMDYDIKGSSKQCVVGIHQTG